MYELNVRVTKVMGACTADPPMKPGDSFTVRDGDLYIPAGGYVCMWALQSLMPMLPAKERESAEARDEDWMWRVHHAQCPDPAGRVIWKIERMGRLGRGEQGGGGAGQRPASIADEFPQTGQGGGLRSLRVVVEEVRGKCTSGMQPGDQFVLFSGRR